MIADISGSSLYDLVMNPQQHYENGRKRALQRPASRQKNFLFLS
jgi:hypothetical protein